MTAALASLLAAASFAFSAAPAGDCAALRLVPFPKEIARTEGVFKLDADHTFEVSADASFFVELLVPELARAGATSFNVRRAEFDGHAWRYSTAPGKPAPALSVPPGSEEAYALSIEPDRVFCAAANRTGLLYGLQTFLQLIRANRTGDTIPCLTVRDWPSLSWRCFQDDLTRGPSSRLETLQRDIKLGAAFKMNLFTYYMESQYAFSTHPLIGPKDGSLLPEELTKLVAFAKRRGIDILGNQQSFAHFEHILKHKEYAHLGEAGYILSPALPESYKLLDDLYSEVIPLLPFPWFNVCCDETWDLGKGPSKDLVAQIGVGGVYVRHIQEVYKLVHDRYGKRMMMWGDIILQHPDKLDRIPKDVIMLTWGYDPRPNFESQIVPFAGAGYEFLVCPGVSEWSRILPDFGAAAENIRNFVRDGAKHGALGMLNTAWDDDGESLNAPCWYGFAWGAECAWNASATSLEDFNRRVGAVLFGEKGDDFGAAVALLAQAFRLPGMDGMLNRRFWKDDFAPAAPAATIRRSAERLKALADPAIERLERCARAASASKELLPYFLFGARRMQLIADRMLDGLAAAEHCVRAAGAPAPAAPGELAKARALVEKHRLAVESLAEEWKRLWLEENKPYALDWSLKRYQAAAARYAALAAKLDAAAAALEAGEPMPAPAEIGLALPEHFSRRTRPAKTEPAPFAPETPWADKTATHRLAFKIKAGGVERRDLPIEVALALPESLAGKPVRAFVAESAGKLRELPAQLERSNGGGGALACMLGGTLPKNATAVVWVYLGLSAAPAALPEAAAAAPTTGSGVWIENDKVKLLLAPEGGHVYVWQVKAASNRDITMPGTTGWAGFADMAFGYRTARHELVPRAQGPALVRYDCVEPNSGLVKTISLFAGASWIEVVLSEPAGHYWDFDDPANFAADGPAPGTYLFSTGATGPVGTQAAGVPAQVEEAGAFWGIKWNRGGLALGLATPEVAARHHVAPGAGAGGVGIEESPPAGHFVTFGGVLDGAPGEVMTSLAATLDFRNQPEVVLHGLQERP